MSAHSVSLLTYSSILSSAYEEICGKNSPDLFAQSVDAFASSNRMNDLKLFGEKFPAGQAHRPVEIAYREFLARGAGCPDGTDGRTRSASSQASVHMGRKAFTYEKIDPATTVLVVDTGAPQTVTIADQNAFNRTVFGPRTIAVPVMTLPNDEAGTVPFAWGNAVRIGGAIAPFHDVLTASETTIVRSGDSLDLFFNNEKVGRVNIVSALAGEEAYINAWQITLTRFFNMAQALIPLLEMWENRMGSGPKDPDSVNGLLKSLKDDEPATPEIRMLGSVVFSIGKIKENFAVMRQFKLASGDLADHPLQGTMTNVLAASYVAKIANALSPLVELDRMLDQKMEDSRDVRDLIETVGETKASLFKMFTFDAVEKIYELEPKIASWARFELPETEPQMDLLELSIMTRAIALIFGVAARQNDPMVQTKWDGERRTLIITDLSAGGRLFSAFHGNPSGNRKGLLSEPRHQLEKIVRSSGACVAELSDKRSLSLSFPDPSGMNPSCEGVAAKGLMLSNEMAARIRKNFEFTMPLEWSAATEAERQQAIMNAALIAANARFHFANLNALMLQRALQFARLGTPVSPHFLP